MEELFRFSVIRAVDRSDAKTLDLQRPAAAIYPTGAPAPPTFPQTLQQVAKDLSNQDRATIWGRLEALARQYLTSLRTFDGTQIQNIDWFNKLIFSQALYSALESFYAQLQTLITGKLTPDQWPGGANWKTTDKWPADASNVALAYWKKTNNLGLNPNNFTSQLQNWKYELSDLFLALLIVRAKGPANINAWVLQDPQLWNYMKFLADDPGLPEIANALQVIDLLLTDPATLKTSDDVQEVLNQTLLIPPGIFTVLEKPIHGVGFREFHVVKQHIRGYELGEIAKIENILKGESRNHGTKHTLSNQQTTFNQTSTTTMTDKELTSTDHVDIQNQVQDQLQEATKLDAGVHAQYSAGTFHLQADLTASYNKSSDQTSKFASDVSKDITQKAVTQVTTQITQSQTTVITETFEEKEDLAFDNKTGKDNISGVYQWIDKVYLAQTFNLGRHLLFDLMVPEPAANYYALTSVQPPNQNIPVQPDPLIADDSTGLPATSTSTVTKPLRPDHLISDVVANQWIAKYQVTGVGPKPPQPITFNKSLTASAGAAPANIAVSDTIKIDDGYYAVIAYVNAYFEGREDSSNQATLNVQVGNYNKSFYGKANEHNLYGQDQSTLNNEQQSIGISVMSNFVNQAAVEIEVSCYYTPELFAGWQLKTYESIIAAWQKLQSDYESKMAALQFQQGTAASLGAVDTDANRLTEREELKRSSIAIIDNYNPTVRGVGSGSGAAMEQSPISYPNSPQNPLFPQLPEPILSIAQDVGSRVRWFEQAFEWENMAYIFYPYYWGRRSTWIQSQNLKSSDPLFLNFLQAGYARVVVPVRIGFEKAVHFYLHTGLPWLGGGLPPIGDKTQNPLYLDIAEEIKATTGGGDDDDLDIPIGDPWEIKLPTTLIRLRKDGPKQDALPSWMRIGPNVATTPPPNLGADPDFPSDPPVTPWTWRDDTPNGLPYTTS